MNYREIIESAYDRKAWQNLLHDIFGNKVQFYATPLALNPDRKLITKAWFLGSIMLDDGQKLGIYEAELNHVDLERNRVGIRNLLTTEWRNRGFVGALQFCYTSGSSELRFSYASETWGFDKENKFRKESTDTHRYTYFLGAGHRSRTAIDQFKKLKASDLTLQDITEAFSIEAVSKRFFDDYKRNYEDVVEHVTGKRMVKVGGKWQEKTTGKGEKRILASFASFANPEKAVRDYVKKLMGRIVFLQFLQKKGWLGVPVGAKWGEGDGEFLRHLFDANPRATFIDDILEPLFDDINTRREGDLANTVLGKGIRVPYLNGGLFERDAADDIDFPLPVDLLTRLFDFFGAYNFTIDENDPEDAEVGVDPEMLSRIFENLLEDNKDKGAFYTPKSIVGYMCRESLTAYLQTGVACPPYPDGRDRAPRDPQCDVIANFVKNHDAAALSPEQRADLLQKLREVKICDPAIGSGAFPMGLLKELFACRKELGDPKAEFPSELKKDIIENNIYGVDIEKGAVDIARLRFWLALVVDEASPHALPNLDFKIMQGNSLLESFGGVPLDHVLEGGSAAMTQGKYKSGKKAGKNRNDYWQTTFAFDAQEAIKEIVRDKNALFNETDHEVKKLLIDRINRNVKQFISGQLDDNSPWQAKIPDGQNDQFFLWHVWFSDVFSRPDKSGFDIVIGNPPYIDSETMTRVMPEIRELYASIYETAKGNWDLFVPFVERGIRLLSDSGVFSYIIPNKIVAAKYAESIRDELAQHTILNIRDYSRIHVFENAAVYPVVLIVRNVYSDLKTNFEIMESEYNVQQCVVGKVGGLPWDVFFQPESICAIVKKAFTIGKRIDEISDISISAAATVSEAYEVKKYLTDKQCSDSFRFINTGTIDPYVALWGLKKTQYIKGGYAAPVIQRQYLKAISENRLAQSDSPKIVIAGMSNRIEAFLDDEGKYLAGKSTTIVVGPIDKLKIAVAILNSSLITFSINTAYASLKMSGGYLNIGQNEIGAIRIPTLGDKTNKISSVVDAILAAKKADSEADTSALEGEIDQLVYKLYGLTDDEIKVVEQAVKK